MNRLRDDVAKSGSDEKLIEAGLVYQDVLPYWQILPSQDNSQSASYQRKVAELKEEIRKSDPISTDKLNGKLYLNQINTVEIKLKC